jgi:transposase InsO family protein
MHALLDSGAQANYISPYAKKAAGLSDIAKEESYSLRVASGERMPGSPRITREVRTTFELGGQPPRSITLDVFDMAHHDVILGLPWLREHNPVIDWKNITIMFSESQNQTPLSSKPVRSTTATTDEKTINYIASHPVPLEKRTTSTDTVRTAGQQVRVLEKKVTPVIPKEYKEFAELFQEELGIEALPKHQSWDHEIVLEDGKQPTFGPIYSLSEKELEVLKDYINVNLKKGFIRESTSPAGYPIIFVPKKNGKLRLCVDYRKLNDITVKNRYPLPNIAELRDRLAHAQIFTALDLRGAYNLIRMKKGEEWKTAFRTRYGHYEYLVMPFGLTNAPATCQALINNVLRAHLDVFVIAYLDDILIYSANATEHIQHVRKVLTLLGQAGLRLEPEKCEFHKEEVEFLGCTVGKHGVKMSEEKIRVVKEWPTPTKVKEIQAFLGFTNYNRQFIRDYSRIAIPLSNLTKKDNTWKWGTEEQNAFDSLIGACVNPPVLVPFRSNEPLRFETDASDLAIGATALQQRDGSWHPIAYHSQKFSGPEERYDVHDKELMAIVAAFKIWSRYAHSCEGPVDVITDHKNLTTFTTTKVLNRRQTRWAETLSQYKFKIRYRAGKENVLADALSRREDIAGTKEIIRGAILKVNNDGTLGPTQELNNMMKMEIQHKVPKEWQEAIIRQHHDDPLHGHPGVTRTMELIRRNYDFENMKDKITSYIKKCADCHKNKHSTHAQYGEMQPMELPTKPWEDISMDFVTGLPLSKDPVTELTYDAILVIVDRFTKYVLMIPFRRDYTAVQLAHVLKDRLIRHFGIPKSIISDRDKLFTSNYWASLMAELGTKRKLSTAYHPQTDGQTERTNRSMKAYLRIYVNHAQNNWVSLLPMAQLSHNNKLSEATGKTPYFAMHGTHPNLFDRTLPGPQAEAAMKTAEEMKGIHRDLQEKTKKAQDRSVTYNNQKRKTAPLLKEGDKVYLLTTNLRTKRKSKGLDNTKVGPFLILKKNGPVTYTLKLPPDARVHPKFHVKLLEPADPETPLQKTFHYETEEEQEFEVEKILKHRDEERIKCRMYLVKWLGYDNTENTWEPEGHLINCKEKVQQYWQKIRKKNPGKSLDWVQDPENNPRR